MPTLVVVTGLLLLFITTIEDGVRSTSKTHPKPLLWKSSTMGLLYHGLDENAALQAHGGADLISGASPAVVRQRVQERAESTKVRLTRDDEGRMRFVAEHSGRKDCGSN